MDGRFFGTRRVFAAIRGSDQPNAKRNLAVNDKAMSAARRVERKWRARLAAAFFSIGPDGTLTYDDPILGPLKNRRGIEVRADLTAARLDVALWGQIVRSFSLSDGDVGEVCRAAANEYFRLVQETAGPSALAA